MNWHKTLNDIYEKLEISGYSEIKEGLHESQLSGGTGGEIFLVVLTKLMDIKKSNAIAYNLIREEIDELITYAKAINYLSSDFEV